MASRGSASSTAGSFVRIEVRVTDAAAGERAAAEAYEAGALGLEERDAGTRWILYAPAADASAVRRALAAVLGPGGEVGEPEPLPPHDWSERWKRGLEPVVVSPRLVLRPSFAAPVGPGVAELVIDPGQAFGTGAHPSTRLALEWIDAVSPGLPAGARVLDVGSGSGALALAALRLGAAFAVACDLDPLAAAASRENAVRNALGRRMPVFVGSLDALAAVGFDLVVANLLRTELLPLLAGIAVRTRPGGRAVLSGLLEAEGPEVARAARSAGLRTAGWRSGRDAGGDAWSALLTTR